jgi:hypothetical protein
MYLMSDSQPFELAKYRKHVEEEMPEGKARNVLLGIFVTIDGKEEIIREQQSKNGRLEAENKACYERHAYAVDLIAKGDALYRETCQKHQKEIAAKNAEIQLLKEDLKFQMEKKT